MTTNFETLLYICLYFVRAASRAKVMRDEKTQYMFETDFESERGEKRWMLCVPGRLPMCVPC